MKTQDNLENIKVFTVQGDEVEGAFLTTTHELWSPDQRQWTILLDPARVKTGLLAHERMGRALVEGERYELVIEGMEDVYHKTMEERFVKSLYITEADTLEPDVGQWDIRFPPAYSTLPFTIIFPDMLDQFSLQQRIMVTATDHVPVEGRVEIGDQERVWTFTPDERWELDDYYLHVNTRLADPAGNNLNGLFDHEPGSLKYTKEGEVLTFTIPVR